MNGLSKAIGGFLGFLLAGPGGCLLGILIGHIFDKNFRVYTAQYHAEQDTQTLHTFIECTFLVMGYLAKLDGRVSETTIQKARATMRQMQLDEHYCRHAMQWFNQGKQPHFNLKATLRKLVQIGQHDPALLQRFLDIQTQVALINGKSLPPQKQAALETIYRILGFSLLQFNWFDPFIDAATQDNIFNKRTDYQYRDYTQHQTQHTYQSPSELRMAYQLLEVSPESTHSDVKKAYRRLMSQYHPDKLASKDLNPAQLKKANDKTQRIKAAYDNICQAKGWS